MLYEGVTRVVFGNIPAHSRVEIRTSCIYERQHGRWWHYDRIVFNHLDSPTNYEMLTALAPDETVADLNLRRVLRAAFSHLRHHPVDPASTPAEC